MVNLPEVVGSIVEAAEWFKTGGISAGRAALAAYLKKRSDAAQEILFDELRSGKLLPEQVATQDDGIAMIHGYMRAAWDGRARVNLRLLAKAITGQLQTGSLIADEFYLHAESLARGEILLIVTKIMSGVGIECRLIALPTITWLRFSIDNYTCIATQFNSTLRLEDVAPAIELDGPDDDPEPPATIHVKSGRSRWIGMVRTPGSHLPNLVQRRVSVQNYATFARRAVRSATSTYCLAHIAAA